MAPELTDRAKSDPAPQSELGTTVQAEGSTIVVLVSGEIDLSCAQALADRLDHVIAESFGPVVLDLSRVTFLDSSGLAVLSRTYMRLSEASRTFCVRDPSHVVHRVLTISGLAALVTDAG